MTETGAQEGDSSNTAADGELTQTRGTLGGLIVVVLIIVGLVAPPTLGRFPRGADIVCDELRSADERASRENFEADLQNQLAADQALLLVAMAELGAQQSKVREMIDALSQEDLQSNGEAEEEIRKAEEAVTSAETELAQARAGNAQGQQGTEPPDANPDALQVEQDALRTAETKLDLAMAEKVNAVEAAASESLLLEIENLQQVVETLESAVRDQHGQLEVKRQRHKLLLQALETPIIELDSARRKLMLDKLRVLPTDAVREIDQELAELESREVQDAQTTERIKELEDSRDDEVDQLTAALNAAPFNPRSSVALQPAIPVVPFTLGPHRSPQRIDVVLVNSASAAVEQGLVDKNDVDAIAELPEKATFVAESGTLGRSDGPEISPAQIDVWVRRFGPNLLMSICISPSAGLPAGTYNGDVFVLDSSLNPVRVPVEVTAQFQWINLLYVLLPIVPSVSMLYVWYVGRISAGEKPWPTEELYKWLKVNLVLLLAVGFASVWATLQVAFANPTWGTTVHGAAAVVGACLVASVTAMTAVAGSVREPKKAEGEGVNNGL